MTLDFYKLDFYKNERDRAKHRAALLEEAAKLCVHFMACGSDDIVLHEDMMRWKKLWDALNAEEAK